MKRARCFWWCTLWVFFQRIHVLSTCIYQVVLKTSTNTTFWLVRICSMAINTLACWIFGNNYFKRGSNCQKDNVNHTYWWLTTCLIFSCSKNRPLKLKQNSQNPQTDWKCLKAYREKLCEVSWIYCVWDQLRVPPLSAALPCHPRWTLLTSADKHRNNLVI